jgi:hypothetical protein
VTHTCCLGGCLLETNAPEANPYCWQFLGALVLLLAATLLWTRVRPRPRPMLRFFAGAAAFLAFTLMSFQVSLPVGSEPRYRFVLEACVFVACTLLLEVAYARIAPRSIARALQRRRKGRVRNRTQREQ